MTNDWLEEVDIDSLTDSGSTTLTAFLPEATDVDLQFNESCTCISDCLRSAIRSMVTMDAATVISDNTGRGRPVHDPGREQQRLDRSGDDQ